MTQPLEDSRPANRDLRAAASAPLAQRLSAKYLEQHCLLPLEIDADGSLRVAVGAPLDPTVVDELHLTYERPVTLVSVPAAEIEAAILSAQSDSASDLMDLEAIEVGAQDGERPALDDLRALASQAPVIKLVNLMLLEALEHRASDVHIESLPEGLRVRQRIDGTLQDTAVHPRQYQAAVISRIKIMANLNIAERRVPQDGRVRIKLSSHELDVRVSTLPTVHGESVVLRILDRTTGVRDLDALGMGADVERRFDKLIRRPNGIVLVTGPTGVRQNHDALRGAAAHQYAGRQDHHRRGPGGVSGRGPDADPRQPKGRADLCQRAPLDSASRPRCRDGWRDA